MKGLIKTNHGNTGISINQHRVERENTGNPGGNAKMQGIRAVMQGNLGMEVIITKNSNENDKLKECREVKIIENEHICKNVISQI